jgi:hypothetical protein
MRLILSVPAGIWRSASFAFTIRFPASRGTPARSRAADDVLVGAGDRGQAV